MYHKRNRLATSLLVALMITLTLPTNVVPAFASGTDGTTVNATVPYGGWVAYTFEYPGDGSNVGLKLTYSPTDNWTENSDNAITLKIYRPDQRPTENSTPKPMVSGDHIAYGVIAAEFSSAKAGTYLVMLQDWGPKRRTIQVQLPAFAAARNEDVDLASSAQGPELSFVSSANGATPALETTSTESSPPSSQHISSTIAADGWVAYSFEYAGDRSQVGIKLTYSPVDEGTERAKNSITLEVYRPGRIPGSTRVANDADPIGSAARYAAGVKYWEFNSSTEGTYIVIVHNWDALKRPVTVTLDTYNVVHGEDDKIDFAASSAGPVLTFVSQNK